MVAVMAFFVYQCPIRHGCYIIATDEGNHAGARGGVDDALIPDGRSVVRFREVLYHSPMSAFPLRSKM